MDGRILTATEAMMKRLYNLNSDYVSRQCSVKSSTVEMEMSNGLIVLKAKFPRSLIEDNIMFGEGETPLNYDEDSDDDSKEDLDEDNTDEPEDTEEEDKTPPEPVDNKKRPVRKPMPKRGK
jgi:hypothetical protein